MLKYIRIILVGTLITVALIIGLLCGFLRPFSPKNSTLFARLIGPLGLKILGVKYELEDMQYLTSNRPCVIIGNHQNNYDIFVVCSFVPEMTVSLGKSELIWIPLFGAFYWLSGNIFVNRRNKIKAMKSMEKVKRIISDKKVSIIIMPEGTRARGRGLLPFKKGAFHTAAHANVPVVPFCVSDWDKHIDLKKWRSGYLKVKALPPIYPQGSNAGSVEELMQKSREIMQAELVKMEIELSRT